MVIAPLTFTNTHVQNHYDGATVYSVQSTRRIYSLFLHTQKTAEFNDTRQEVYILICLLVYHFTQKGSRERNTFIQQARDIH
jgi:hypothetical protein